MVEGQDGKLGTTAFAFQERFNFPLQIKKLPQRPRIFMWVPCRVKGISEIQAVGTLFFKFSLIHRSVALWCAWNQTHKHNPCVVVLLDCFQSNFLNLLARHGQQAVWTHNLQEFRVSAWYGQVNIFVFFQDVGKCDHKWQWLSKCVKRTSGFLGRSSGMR